jgi:hypothetical protein
VWAALSSAGNGHGHLVAGAVGPLLDKTEDQWARGPPSVGLGTLSGIPSGDIWAMGSCRQGQEFFSRQFLIVAVNF